MSAGSERTPLAPWAFRAAMSGLDESRVRDLLEGDRCPRPDPREDPTEHVIPPATEDALLVYREGEAGAWLQSDEYVALSDVR